MHSNDTITKTIIINAEPEIVWQYLTEAEKLARWFHPAKKDLLAGEDYALVSKDDPDKKLCWGKVEHMQQPTSMVWSFTVQPLQGATTTVRWTLEPFQTGTRLTLTHEGVGKAAGELAMNMLLALDKGWDEHFDALRQQTNAAADAAACQ